MRVCVCVCVFMRVCVQHYAVVSATSGDYNSTEMIKQKPLKALATLVLNLIRHPVHLIGESILKWLDI